MNSLYDSHSFVMRFFIQIKFDLTFSTPLWEKKTIVLIRKQKQGVSFKDKKMVAMSNDDKYWTYPIP